MRKMLFILGLFSLCSFSFAQNMPAQYVVQNVPTPNSTQKKNLTLFSDKPNDPLILSQKRSLRNLDFSSLPFTNADIDQEFFSIPSALAISPDFSQSGYLAFKNFIHGMKTTAPFQKLDQRDQAIFWNMVIPKSAQIEDAIFQIEWFGEGVGAHAQIRIKLNTPILLISQENSNVRKMIPGDLIFSLMALRSQNGQQSWGALTGLTGVFANSYSLASTEHMAYIQTNSEYVEQYKMSLDQNQKSKLLQYILMIGPKQKEKEVYNLVFNSCIQAIMRALNVVDPNVNPWIFNPYVMTDELKKAQLISDDSQMMSLNEEYKSPFQVLLNDSNRQKLEFVQKNLPIIKSPAFNESVSLLAYIIIEDRWKFSELQFAMDEITKLVAQSRASGKKLDPKKLAAELANKIAQSNLPPQQKTRALISIQKLVSGVVQILDRNNISGEDLNKILLSLRSR